MTPQPDDKIPHLDADPTPLFPEPGVIELDPDAPDWPAWERPPESRSEAHSEEYSEAPPEAGRAPASAPFYESGRLHPVSYFSISNASGPPWRWIASLEITYRGGRTNRGTAWFIGPRTLVTAAHNLVHPQLDNAVRIVISAGKDVRQAHGGVSDAIIREVAPGWHGGKGGDAHDYAVISLRAGVPPSQGWFKFENFHPPTTMPFATLCGYRTDRPHHTQYTCEGHLLSWKQGSINYPFLTGAGMSGAPLWVNDKVRGRVVIGLHVSLDDRIGHACRIDGKVLNFLRRYSGS